MEYGIKKFQISHLYILKIRSGQTTKSYKGGIFMNQKLIFTDRNEKMTVTAYCCGTAESFTRDGHKYVKASLRDLDGNIRTVQGFDKFYEYYHFLQPGHVYDVDVYYDTKYYNFVNNIGTENTEVHPAMFLGNMCYDQSYKEEFTNLYKSLRTPLHELLQQVFYKNRDDFVAFGNIPFSKDKAYNKRGGLFKLTVDLAEFVKLNAEQYNLDVDLCIASALLYNMGEIDNKTLMGDDVPDRALLKTETNTIKRLMKAVYRMESQGYSFDGEDFRLIEHILMTRNAKDIPATPEAILLRAGNDYCQMLDMCRSGMETLGPGESILDMRRKTASYKKKQKLMA